MDWSRISFGEMVAAASGFALFVFMFIGWFEIEEEVSGFGQLGSEAKSAWAAFSLIDLILFIVVVIAVGQALARAAGVMPDLGYPPGQVVFIAGCIALFFILFRLLFPPELDPTPGVETGRKIGVFLGFLAAGGIAFGGFTAMAEQTTGQAPREREPSR